MTFTCSAMSSKLLIKSIFSQMRKKMMYRCLEPTHSVTFRALLWKNCLKKCARVKHTKIERLNEMKWQKSVKRSSPLQASYFQQSHFWKSSQQFQMILKMQFQWTIFSREKSLNNEFLAAQKILIKLSSKSQHLLSCNNKILQLRSRRREDLSEKALYLIVKNCRRFSKSSTWISSMIKKVQIQ